MRSSHRRALAVAVGAATSLLLGVVHHPARADDYSNADFLNHDLDNIARSVGPGSRQITAGTDPAQVQTGLVHGIDEWVSNVGTQVSGLPAGRVHGTLGAPIPGGTVGDPVSYGAMTPIEVDFASRTGAALHGQLWWDGQPGPHPGIVITSGSIQSPAVGYHWAAQSLAAAGYLVLTWDPQGQGETETFGHAPGDPLPTSDGVPFQRAANFIDGTVDALLFLLSTPASGYVPGTWSSNDAVAHRAGAAGAGLSWVNPLWSALDGTRLGLAGHSLGGTATTRRRGSTGTYRLAIADHYRSAYRCHCAPGGATVAVSDIRAAVGLSPVGDWAGANADRPAVRPG